MIDPRVTKLAELLCNHSVRLTPDDKVLIHAFDIPDECVAEMVRVVQSKGAQAAVRLESGIVRRQIMQGLTEANVKTIAAIEKYEMEQVTAYIALRGTVNPLENAEVSGENLRLWGKEYTTPVVFGVRIPKTKWVALRWPNPAMAMAAGMSTPAFEDFYFRVCTLDYKKMAEAAKETGEASAGGGMVTVVATAAGVIKELRIDPKAIDPDDPELLADLVMAAANEALRAAQAKVEAKMKSMLPPDLGGLLPGL